MSGKYFIYQDSGDFRPRVYRRARWALVHRSTAPLDQALWVSLTDQYFNALDACSTICRQRRRFERFHYFISETEKGGFRIYREGSWAVKHPSGPLNITWTGFSLKKAEEKRRELIKDRKRKHQERKLADVKAKWERRVADGFGWEQARRLVPVWMNRFQKEMKAAVRRKRQDGQ